MFVLPRDWKSFNAFGTATAALPIFYRSGFGIMCPPWFSLGQRSFGPVGTTDVQINIIIHERLFKGSVGKFRGNSGRSDKK